MLSLWLVLIFFKLSDTARILCVFPMPVYSHQYVFRPIWEELSARGHNVTIITTNPVGNLTRQNLRQIDLSFTYKLAHEDLRMQDVINTEVNVLSLIWHVLTVAHNITTEQLSRPQVRNLILDDDAAFDLMIVEVHVPAWFGLAAKFKCPIIGIISVEAPARLKRIMGTPVNPVVNPHINLPFAGDHHLSFFQRVAAVLFEVFDEMVTDHLLVPMQQQIIRTALGNNLIDLHQIIRNMSLLFSYEIPGFNKPGLRVPAVVELHGLHISVPRGLPQDLQEFLDGAPNGAVYFSLGSSVQSAHIPKDKRDIILEVFRTVPYRILWKFEQTLEDLPPNVKVIRWAPQQDVLRHKNVRLFISQGGIHSVEEAILFKVPVLGIPFFGDQFHNVKRLEQLGAGLCLNLETLTVESLRDSMFRLIGVADDDEKYVKRMHQISDLLAEQPLKSIDKAIWWIEYVLKHGGADHLKSPPAEMPFYRYCLVGAVILFGGAVIFLCRKISTATLSNKSK